METQEIKKKESRYRMLSSKTRERRLWAKEIKILLENNDRDVSDFETNLANKNIWTLFFLTNNISSQQPRTKEDVTQNYTYVKLEPCQKKVEEEEEEEEVEVKKARLEQYAGSKKYKKRKTNKRRRTNKRRTIRKKQRRQIKSRK